MKVDRLKPLPDKRTQFAWSHHVIAPEQPGCYALATYSGEVLYVGLATSSVRDRMGIHLDTPKKRKANVLGAAFWFYYLVCNPAEVNAVERGWMNQTIMEDGAIPLLNSVYSPL